MSNVPSPVNLAGTVPWLPWPLSASSWWTRPVRAEYLAVVRIGIALTLLYSQVMQYLPCLDALYGADSTGSPEVHRFATDAPAWHWSLLYGLDHSPIAGLSLALWLVLTLWIGLRLAALPAGGREDQRSRGEFRVLLLGWFLAGLVGVLGVWIRGTATDRPGLAVWLVPAVLLGTAIAFLAVGLIRFRQAGVPFLASTGGAVLLVLVGIALTQGEGERLLFRALFVGWGDNFAFLRVVFYLWILSTVCLGLGLATSLAAIVVWVLAVSFANLNPLVNHGGDLVRNIILFYMMLCPCGAAWSLDRLLARRRGRYTAPVYVAPWPLRLLLIQLVLIYFFTGLFKLFGEMWRNGDALYYTLADLFYARMSLAQVALPLWLLRLMSWSVLFWEVSFPLWLVLRWTRIAALLAGVLFHAGTLVLLELGGFEWYMLVLYLPLLPWARWLRDPGLASRPAGQGEGPPGQAGAAGWSARWKPELLGLFVVWQLAFLGLANLVGYLRFAAPQLPGQAAAVAEDVAPGWTAQEGHFWDLLHKVGAVTDFWAHLTEQGQFWRMYHELPVVSTLPFIEISSAGEADASSPDEGPQILLSDPALADPYGYFRLGTLRLDHVNAFVIPDLSEGEAEEKNEARAREIAAFVGASPTLIRNYLACWVRHWRARHPDTPQPEQVVLWLRRYPINPPGSPTVWGEPEEVPIARWLPGVEDVSQSVEVFNPVTGQFEALAASEQHEEGP
jgi:hypothetical protein